MLLADYRMPQMNGIEFLEQAMDLFPRARRVLLTAYADTDAAIEAINVVDLDHYLLKPWDPPEEKLYPVIDAQLRGLAASDHQPVARDQGGRPPLVGAVVRGPRLPGPQPGAVPLVRRPTSRRASGCSTRPAPTAATLPVVITPDGTALVAPTDAELAAHVGLTTTPAERLLRPGRDRRRPGRARRGGLRRVRGAAHGAGRAHATGGQAGQSSRIENYLGFPDGVSGAQLTDRARRQAVKFGAELLTTRDVVGARGQRLGPDGPVRRRQRDRRAHA